MYQDGRRIVYFRPHNDKINPAVIPHEIVPGCRSRLGPEEKRCAVVCWGSNFSIFGISGILVSKKKLNLPYLSTPKESTIEIHQRLIRNHSVRLLVLVNIFCFHFKKSIKTSIIVPLMADSTLLNSRNIRTASSAGTLFLSTI